MADPIYPLDPDDPTADLDASVIAFSTRLVKLALSRIGVSKKIENLATDTCQEAVTARLHLTPALNFVLAAFNWPFARRYATLTLVDGSASEPVNGDWLYSYRVPADLYVPRRIVPPRNTSRHLMSQAGVATTVAANDDRPPFDMGADDDGPLLFTDEATVELEYTTRPAHLVRLGSPAFRSCAAWRLAAELAKPLSRDAKDRDFALQMFAYELRAAEASALNESQPPKDGDASWNVVR